MATWETQAATREYQMAANGELTVVERLATLLETGQYADVSIRVGQGNGTTTFKAHRLLLATASQSLNNLVSSNTGNGPGEGAILHITDVEPEAFSHVLRFIYTDDLSISSIGEAFALLRMSKQWGLTKLVNKTSHYLEGFLELYEPSSEEKKNELCDLILLTEADGSQLNKKCWEILIRDVNKIVPCQGFLNMSEDMVRKMLTHEDFDFKNHLTLFEAIRDWGMNQVLMRHLSVNQLQTVIGNMMQYVNFKAIKDVDFIDTILPSECLGKGDLIAFFLARGLEIPRDLAYNNNIEDSSVTKDGSKLQCEKTCRFKRGFKLPTNEIHKEHELRFRVDKRLRLLGVGFGFLFSNTDMGITVHCQGPWETRQWSDIMQTYCRVSYEKMKTADVRLMFSEAVTIEPNQSYKVLVRISRMTAGSSDVDLWGGSQGITHINMNDAEFTFLKAAVDPRKQVDPADMDNNPGMITDLIYQLCDETDTEKYALTSSVSRISKSPSPTLSLRSLSPVNKEKTPPPPLAVHRSQRTVPPPTAKRLSQEILEPFSVQPYATIEEPASPSVRKPVSYRRTISATQDAEKSETTELPWQKSKDDKSPYYRPQILSSSRTPNRLPSYLNKTRLVADKNKPVWEIPSRMKTETTSNLRSREPSVTKERELSQSKYDTESRFSSSRTFPGSARYGTSRFTSTTSSPSSRFASGVGTSRYGSGVSTYSRYGSTTSDSPSSTISTTSTSRYGTNPGDSKSGDQYSSHINTRYGIDSSYSPSFTSRYGSSKLTTSSDASQDSTIRRSGGSTSTSLPKYGEGSSLATSKPKESDSSTSYKYGKGDTFTSRYGGTNSLLTSRYGDNTSVPTSRFSKSDTSTSTRLGGGASSTSSRFTGSETSSTSKYGGGSDVTASPISRFSDTSSRIGSTSSNIGSRYNSAVTSSRYGTSSATTAREKTPIRPSSALGRYGTTSSSSLSSSYGGLSSRFGSSVYRR